MNNYKEDFEYRKKLFYYGVKKLSIKEVYKFSDEDIEDIFYEILFEKDSNRLCPKDNYLLRSTVTMGRDMKQLFISNKELGNLYREMLNV